MCFINSISSGERIDSIPGRWGKGEFRGRFDIEAIYCCTLATKALGSDKALRLLRPQAGLQQVRVADLPGTPAEGHSSLLVLDHSKLIPMLVYLTLEFMKHSK